MSGDDPRDPAPPPGRSAEGDAAADAAERIESEGDGAPAAPPPVQVTAPANWPSGVTIAAGDLPIAARPFPELREPVPPPPPLPSAAPSPHLDSSPAPRSAPRRRKPLVRRLAVLAVQIVFAFVLESVLWVAAYRFVPPPITLTMANDVAAGRGATRHWLPIASIDRDMARAVIAAEDARFCSHSGFDYAAIQRAWEANQRGGRIRGGSTISQQTAKNVFLWQGGGYFRKALEAWFTFLIETFWGKRRILEVYLNVAETGIGTYGVDAGAQRYFGHGAGQLSPREAAQIAAVLPLPKQRPGVAPSGFTRRYANAIQGGIGAVRTQRLDACID